MSHQWRTDVVVCSHTPRFDLPCQQSPNQRHSTANRFSKPSEIQDIRRTDRNLSTLSPIRRPGLGRVQPCATTVYRCMFSTSSIALAFSLCSSRVILLAVPNLPSIAREMFARCTTRELNCNKEIASSTSSVPTQSHVKRSSLAMKNVSLKTRRMP